MGTKDTRAANGAAAKKDMLLFDDDKVVLVTDEKHALYDDRVHDEPSEAMILNIIAYGVIEPIVVWKDPETGKVLVADGRQRVKACREANRRIRKAGGEPHRIPAIPRRMDAGTSVGVMISLNEQRKEDSPLNLAKKAARMLELGKTEVEVGIALGRSASSVKNLVGLLDAPAAVRHAVESEKITVSDGYKLAKLEPEEARKKVERLIAEAPRAPGKKRSPNAKKAREIVTGKKNGSDGRNHDGMRERHQVENLLAEVESEHAQAALRWVLGEDAALKVLQ